MNNIIYMTDRNIIVRSGRHKIEIGQINAQGMHVE